MQDRGQLGDLWRRFNAHSPQRQALFLAFPLAVTVLVILGALALAGPSAPGPSEASPTSGPAGTVGGGGPATTATPAPAPTRPAGERSPTAGSAPTAAAVPSPTPAPSPTLPPGARRIVRVANTEGQGANLRAEPRAGSERVKVVREGTELEVIGPDQETQGQVWRNVRDDDDAEGWIVRDFLADERVAGPRPTPTPIPLSIQVTDITSPVTRGEVARLTIATRPGVRCEVRVLVYGPSTVPREGLEPKQADDGGECSWSWTVPQEIVAGTWRYLIAVGTGGERVTREVAFGVR